MKTVYVFALADHPIAPFDVAGHRVEFLDCDGLHAAIERRSERPVVSESSLRTQHDIIMHLANRIDAIVPARFGALIEERALRDILTARRAVIREALALVCRRVQMTVRFRLAPESMSRRKPPVAAAAANGTAYLEARRSALTAMPAVSGVVTAAVADLSIAERSEAGTRREQAVLYHLIDRASVARYSKAISALHLPAVSVSGPWPPFAFVPDLWR